MNDIVCPICESTKVSFFSKHNKVEQSLYICRSCGFFFVYPHKPIIPGGEGDAFSAKNVDFWGTEASIGLYLKWRAEENKRIVNVIKKFGSVGKVLEIGFGDGALTKHLLPMTDEYWGIEPGEACFATTVQTLGINPDKALCIKAEDMANAKPLMSRKNTFAMIILVSVLEHLSIPCQIIETCHALLRPGGKLFISTPNSQYFIIFYILRRLMGIDAWSVAHISFFKKSNLTSMLDRIGFAVDEITLAPLITSHSIRYFRELYGSSLLGAAMLCFRRLRLDSLLNINTINVVLTKRG